MKFNMKQRGKWQFVKNVFNGVCYRDGMGSRVNKIKGGTGICVLNSKEGSKEGNVLGMWWGGKKALTWAAKRDHVRKGNVEQLPAPAADELTPFAASVFPSARRQASSVRRGQPGAALAGWSAGWSLWRAGAPFLPGSLEYLVREERERASDVRSGKDKHKVESLSHKHRYRYVFCIPERRKEEKCGQKVS